MGPKRKSESDYERLLSQERLILDATETIVGLLEEQEVSRQELARRLGRSKGFVSQLLSGERNMTLRTLADLGYALGYRFSVAANPSVPGAHFRAVEPRAVFGSFDMGAPRRCSTSSREAVEASLRGADANSHEYALAA